MCYRMDCSVCWRHHVLCQRLLERSFGVVHGCVHASRLSLSLSLWPSDRRIKVFIWFCCSYHMHCIDGCDERSCLDLLKRASICQHCDDLLFSGIRSERRFPELDLRRHDFDWHLGNTADLLRCARLLCGHVRLFLLCLSL